MMHRRAASLRCLMRRTTIATALVAAALLAGCGKTNTALIPGDRASALQNTVDQVQEACNNHDVQAAQSALDEASAQVNELPRKVDRQLKANLRDWINQIERRVDRDCQETPTPDGDPDADRDADAHGDPDADRDADAHAHADADADTHPDRDGHRDAGRRRDGGAVRPDALFAGRYRLERRLGVGGMATVQLAFDTRLERNVAVKLLAEHLAEDGAFVSRFRREALAAARLVHPNIVQVFDFGLDEPTHRNFIVMEFVDGQSCAEMLRERGEAAGRRGGRDPRPVVPRARLRAPQRRRAPRRQARQPAEAAARGWSSSPTSASPRRPRTPTSPRSARCSARPPTWRRSRRAARPPAPPPTCTRSASSPTSCSPAGSRTTPAR